MFSRKDSICSSYQVAIFCSVNSQKCKTKRQMVPQVMFLQSHLRGQEFPTRSPEHPVWKSSREVAANPLSRDLGRLPFFANSKPSGRNVKGTVQSKPREGWLVAVDLASTPLVSGDTRHSRGAWYPTWPVADSPHPGAESALHVCAISSKDCPDWHFVHIKRRLILHVFFSVADQTISPISVAFE